LRKERFISRDALNEWAARLAGDGARVVAPSATSDGAVEYRSADAGRPLHLDLDAVLARRSLKEFFLPPTETLFSWVRRKDGVGLEPAPTSFPRTVIIGAAPCDAAALPIVDKVMDWDYHDELWFGRRDAATIVTLACPGCDASGFCTAVGLGPDSAAGADVLLTPAGAGFVAAPVTPKGEALLAAHTQAFAPAPGEAVDEARCFQSAARERASRNLQFDAGAARGWLDAHFEHDVWRGMALRCHGCGACAALCPTCHCFDIVDEPEGLNSGARRRNWDTCQSGKFTMHASGHNPRAEQNSRFRQRVLHKFAIYPARFGAVLCTGCGRCARACPAGMDLPEILGRIARLAAGGGAERDRT